MSTNDIPLQLRSIAGEVDALSETLADASASIRSAADAVEAWEEPATPADADPRYRCQTRMLFQAVAFAAIPARLPGLDDYDLEKLSGPTKVFVEAAAGWKWTTPGGDVGPATSVVSANLYPKGSAGGWYTMDAKAALLQALDAGRPWAFKIASTNDRTMAGRHSDKPPRLTLTMVGGAVVDVPCWLTEAANASSPKQCAVKQSMSAFIEFVRPAVDPAPDDIESAVLEFYVTDHNGTSSAAKFTLHLLTPDISLPPVEPGGIADAYPMDQGIEAAPGVLFVHAHRDTQPESDFLDWQLDVTTPDKKNIEAARNFSPDVFGLGPADHSKFPYRGYGRFVNVSPLTSIVRSTYRGDGFEPLAPGIGAMRVHVPREERSADGSLVYGQGTQASKMELFLPIGRMWYQREISIRYYIRWGVPEGHSLEFPLSALSCVWQKSTNGVLSEPAWTSVGGKHGIVPTCDSKDGGFSGSSGGPGTLQDRLIQGRIPTGLPGPQSRGLYCGWHGYDFQGRFHPLGLPSAGSTLPWPAGKVGGILYANRWYCLEHILKLNSVDEPGYVPEKGPDGKPTGNMIPHLINGVQQYWVADGEQTILLDDMRVWHDKGMIFHTHPTRPKPANYNPLTSSVLYGHGDNCIRAVLCNIYAGGTTPNSDPISIFHAGLVVCDGRRIGQMMLR